MGIDPATLALISLATTVVGGGIGAIGAMNQAEAASQNAAYQAQVARNNQKLAEYQVEQTAQTGAANEERLALRQRAIAGQLDTSMAANNVDINSGSNENVRRSQAELDALDALSLRHDTAQKIYGYQVAGTSYGAEAALRDKQSSDASAAGPLDAVGSLLSTAGQATNQYFSWMKVAGDTKGGGASRAKI